jgi:hypothetical protein
LVDYPIFEEVRNFIYTNLETIFLVIVPFATLIGWLAERHNKRLNHIEEVAIKLISDLKIEIAERDKRLDEQEKDYNQFKLNISKDLAILKALLRHDFDDTDDDDVEFFIDKNKNKRRKRTSSS